MSAQNYTPLPVAQVPNKVGRPSVINEETVKKLEEVFKLDVPDRTACSYAGISHVTYYEHLKTNEEFSNRMEKAKQYARLAAGNVVMKAITKDNDVQTARWWLEKKHKNEFGGDQVNVAVQVNNHISDKKESYGI